MTFVARVVLTALTIFSPFAESNKDYRIYHFIIFMYKINYNNYNKTLTICYSH